MDNRLVNNDLKFLGPSHIITNKKFHIFIILIFASIILFTKLWEGGLATYDDCYYAQQAKEILQTGDWLTMHYDKKPLFENDPVYLWCMAIMFKLFGVSEYTARFPSALFGVGTILLVFFLGNKLYGGYVGLFSSFFLMTTQYFTKFARHSMLDVTLAFFVTLSILFLVKGVFENKKYYILFGFFCGIAMLTKNILGFFPFLIAIAYFIGTGRFKEIFNPFFLIGSVFGISLPFSWWLYEYLKNGLEFLDVHFGWIILRRAFVIDKEKNTFLSYFGYIKDLWFIYLPWIPITIYGFFRLLKDYISKRDYSAALLVLWSGITFGILSLSIAKKQWYLMSLFPCFAIINAKMIDTWFSERNKLKIIKGIIALCIFVTLVITCTPIRLDWNRNADMKKIAAYVQVNANPDEKVLLYKFDDYWIAQLPFLFYSDRSLTRSVMETEVLNEKLEKGENRFCLTTVSVWKELVAQKAIKNLNVLISSGDYVLFSCFQPLTS